jgi:hypothetical protein
MVIDENAQSLYRRTFATDGKKTREQIIFLPRIKPGAKQLFKGDQLVSPGKK